MSWRVVDSTQAAPAALPCDRDGVCLKLNWFRSIDEVKKTVEAWRRDYNESRPHMALEGMTPREFSLRNGKLPRTENEITTVN